MHKCLVFIIVFAATGLFASPVLDGVISPSEGWNFLVANPDTQTSSFEGADIESLFYFETRDSLYIAFTTQNRASWGVAYGIAFDTDRGNFSGYVSGGDAWGRNIIFGDGIDPTFCIDYQVYMWWDGSGGSITAWYFYRWNQDSLRFEDIGFPMEDRAYTGDASTGLQCIEMRFPLDKFGNPDSFRFVAYMTGGDGSSIVDILPQNPSVEFPATGGEWTDQDTIATFVRIYGHEGVPEAFPVNGNVVFYDRGYLFIGGTGVVDVTISDIAGRIVLKRRLNLSQSRTVVFDKPCGIYFVRVEADGVVKTGKISIIK